jgi:valyl-tRNA synthetase
MLGDTGIAVNPEDERYAGLLGKTVTLPLMNREIPVFADSFVDKSFGTGLVKVTPAHDPNDFEMGKRHNLEEVIILDLNAAVNENGGPYRGLPRFQAREKIIEDLEALGLLTKVEDHDHSVGHCYRCGTVIEPYLSKQWFVRIKPLADAAIEAVEKKRVRFVPQNWEKTYLEWMYNIRDWCISRQLWWGHRIPAFYCNSCEHITVSMEDPATCEKCKSTDIRQDEDVLDTWFSSALWPFSTLGWPEETAALKKYYPTSVLVTAFDIIFFWVARMIMMGLKFINDVPFRDVYIHAIVRDEHGHKMSKSRGNVIDPLITMDRYGTDAFRFTLAIFAAQGRDIVLSEKRIEGYRAFCNKIWNATRYILMNLGDGFSPGDIDAGKLEPFDRWMLHRLSLASREVTRALGEYRFNEAAQLLYDFWWHEFCDWYLELTKPRIYAGGPGNSSSGETAKQVLYYVLDRGLRLLHPFMPFITEEIWSRMPSRSRRLIVSDWPDAEERFNFAKESGEAELFKEIVYKIRNIRGEMNVPPDRQARVVFKTANDDIVSLLKRESVHLRSLAKAEHIEFDSGYAPAKEDASAVLPELEIFVPLKGLIDIRKERARLEKERERVFQEIERVEKKLANGAFIQKAPAHVLEKERTKSEELGKVLEKLDASLAKLPTG